MPETLKPKPATPPSLRDQAEQRLALDDGAAAKDLPIAPQGDDTLMLHELRVHQIELELQNEELRRAQIELESSRARYFDLFDLAPVGYLTLSELGLILEANFVASKLLGLPRGALVGKWFSAFIAPPDQDAYYLFSKTVLERNILHNCTLRMLAHGGVTFWAHLEAIEATREGLSPVVRITLTDSSAQVSAHHALKTLNLELARSNADLEQFAYAASHDLLEPLRSVSSSVQLLRKRYGGQLDATADNFIRHAVDGSTRMQSMIKDLLAYSRVRADGTDNHAVSMQLAFDQACGNLGEAIVQNAAQIICGELPMLQGNLGQLTQLFQNLVGNALKFNGGKPAVVEVQARRQANDWLFSVKDHGIGIEPQYLERIFKLFQRLHTREEYAGTGIGLTLCKKIVERHGGTIWVESVPEVGTTVFFTLPATSVSVG